MSATVFMCSRETAVAEGKLQIVAAGERLHLGWKREREREIEKRREELFEIVYSSTLIIGEICKG
jgi:hypothetical protein